LSKVVIDTEKLDALVIKFPEMVDKAIRATAFDVAGNAAGPGIAIDTGAMRASIFTKTHNGSNYADASSAAQSLRPGVEINDPTPATPPLMTAYSRSSAQARWRRIHL
jgi:hypothetical protein